MLTIENLLKSIEELTEGMKKEICEFLDLYSEILIENSGKNISKNCLINNQKTFCDIAKKSKVSDKRARIELDFFEKNEKEYEVTVSIRGENISRFDVALALQEEAENLINKVFKNIEITKIQ